MSWSDWTRHRSSAPDADDVDADDDEDEDAAASCECAFVVNILILARGNQGRGVGEGSSQMLVLRNFWALVRGWCSKISMSGRLLKRRGPVRVDMASVGAV